MKKLLALGVVALATCFTLGCSKSKDEPQTTLQKIQGQWLLVSSTQNDHYSGADHITPTTGTSNDVFDFRTDGKVYSSVSGLKDTVTYSLVGDTKLTIDGLVDFNITTLTSNSFVIQYKELYGSSDFDEVTVNWKR